MFIEFRENLKRGPENYFCLVANSASPGPCTKVEEELLNYFNIDDIIEKKIPSLILNFLSQKKRKQNKYVSIYF